MHRVIEIGRPTLVALVLSLAGAMPALAYDADPSTGAELPCSALCRYWMGLGKADASVAPAAESPGAPPAPARSPTPRLSGDVAPVARRPEKSRTLTQAKVPLPPSRPRDAAPSRVAAAEPPPRPIASLSPVSAPVPQRAPDIAPVISVAPPPPVPPLQMTLPPAPTESVAAPSVASPHVSALPAAAERVETQGTPLPVPTPPVPAESIAAPAAPRPVVQPSAPVAPIAEEVSIPVTRAAARPVPPSPGTPWSVRLGFYAVLAGLAGWAFPPRRIGPQRDDTVGRRAPDRAGSVRVRAAGGLQYPAVDAL